MNANDESSSDAALEADDSLDEFTNENRVSFLEFLEAQLTLQDQCLVSKTLYVIRIT